jgi:hypothetical protein
MALAAGGAQAVVIDMGAGGATSVTFPTDQANYFGVALVPNTRGSLPTVSSDGPCSDPALPSDLTLPSTGLCSHGGPVIHKNETFALYWDPGHGYFQTTKNYVDQFLRDVANGSGSLSSPYAVTSQYTDASGRAANASLFGGPFTDFGSASGGNDYPANGCPVSGTDFVPDYTDQPNTVCLTDAQLRPEITTLITQNGLTSSHLEPGYSPLFVLLTPPGVETCLDAAGTMCSANGASTAQFCSYHGHLNVGGMDVAYLVQPWTAATQCDEPDAPAIPSPVDAQTLATDLGIRLVSPLSQAQIAAIVNPSLGSWFALDGSEINDNGCQPLGKGLDSVNVAGDGYLLQREFNNGGVIVNDPNALPCAPAVGLVPRFVVPSAVNQGDVVQLDGSTSASSLVVPRAGYAWDFGDGSTAIGPSVVHSWTRGGTYSVTLTITDRGGNVASLTQTIIVLGPTGNVVPTGNSSPTSGSPGLHVRLQLMPQSLKSLVRSGVSLSVMANEPADGLATISIARSAAKRAHIKAGHSAAVVIGRGTVSGIKAGTVGIHLRLSKRVAAKLKRLGHVSLTISLTLIDAGGDRQVVVVAGRY